MSTVNSATVRPTAVDTEPRSSASNFFTVFQNLMPGSTTSLFVMAHAFDGAEALRIDGRIYPIQRFVMPEYGPDAVSYFSDSLPQLEKGDHAAEVKVDSNWISITLKVKSR